jgi:glycosyltransferase involved in cell wall biosynthesis
MPAYGRAALIRDAIVSCPRIVDGMPVEVIVVDDGSPESLEPIVAPMGVVFHRLSQNAGSSVARNAGLALAKGRYIKYLDSDDVLCPWALADEVAVAEATGADIVVAGWRNVTLNGDGSSSVVSEHAAPVFSSIHDDLLAGRGVPTSAALYRRSSVEGVRWDADLSKINDWDYFVQAALVSKSIATCPVIAYDWRAHEGERITTSSSFLKHADEFFCILGKLIDALAAADGLTAPRRQRSAQYLYKELRVLYRFDRPRGRETLKRIIDFDPEFIPVDEEHSKIFRFLGRVGLLSPALEVYGLGRHLVDRFRGSGR